VAFGACALDKQSAPALAGPSELALSLNMTASPDVIMQDGQSTSTIQVTARDGNGTPMRGVFLRASITIDGTLVDFGTLSTRTLSTDSTGRATVVYTAPPTPPPTVTSDTVVAVTIVPVGSDFTNEVPRSVHILVARPGTIVPPGSSDITPSFSINPQAPAVGQQVIFQNTSTIRAGSLRKITSVSWTFGDGGTGSGNTASHAFQKVGNFAITMTVTDDLGGTSSAAGSVSIGGNPPHADIVVSPSNAIVGETVTFSGLTSVPGAGRTINGYFWSFGDGGSGGGATAQHQYQSAGTFTVVLTVTDDFGQEASASKTVTINDIKVELTASPDSPTVGQSVAFNASATKLPPGRTIVQCDWDFGDGNTATTVAPNASHPYGAVGGYTVVLRIRDDQGHIGVGSVTVTVK
jgi:chitodextrinase